MDAWFRSTGRFADPHGALRLAQFRAALARFAPGHLLDLGAGHGIFSRMAADLGWRVTAVDARDARFPADQRISWVVQDVRDYDGYDGVDVIACLGLWYHLTLEDQRSLAARFAPRPLILDTCFALADRRLHRQSHSLSDFVVHEGFEGRLYDESEVSHTPTASWGNERSFWPTTDSFDRELFEAGYDSVEHVRPSEAERHFVVAQCWGAEARKAMDEAISRYNRLTSPDAALSPLPSASPPAIRDGGSRTTRTRVARGVQLVSRLRKRS